MKTKVKFLIVFAIILFAICLLNVNEVRATEVNEEYLNNLVNLLPDSINLDIPESQFDQVTDLSLDKIKQILNNNNIQCSRINESNLFLRGGLKIDNTTINGYDLVITTSINLNRLKRENLYNTKIYIYATNYKTIYGNYSKSKDVEIIYNNSNNYNLDDETYVKNLKITSPLYYEVSLDWLNKNRDTMYSSGKGIGKLIEDYYTKLLNDDSIVVKFILGAGGAENGLNQETYESGTIIAIFKNGILYDIRIMGNELTIPVIIIPNNVEDDNIISYASDLITKEYNVEISAFEKGGIYEGKIQDVYSVTIKNHEESSSVIIRREKKTINKEDTTTNIQLEADTTIIPENTELITEKIENYANTMLTNTNEFYAYDITLKSNGVKVQPNGKVKIRIPIPEGMETSNLVVYRVEENELIKYDVTIEEVDGAKFAVFETDHFSTYILADNSTKESQEENDVTNEETKTGEKDETPKTGTNIIEYIWKIIKEII